MGPTHDAPRSGAAGVGILNTPLEITIEGPMANFASAGTIWSVWLLVSINLAVTAFNLAILIRLWRLEMARRPRDEQHLANEF